MSTLLIDPHPCRHIVYPYNDEKKALSAVFLFASSGLSKQESVLLIATDARREPIISRLTDGGVDVLTLQAAGQLKCMSADKLLGRCTPQGILEESIFRDTLSSAIERLKAKSPAGKVRIFGEMVSILLSRNEVAVAARLEELWNEVIEAHSVTLFCTYTLLNSGYRVLPESLAKLHTDDLSLSEPDRTAKNASAND